MAPGRPADARRARRRPAAALVVATVAVLVLAVVYAAGGHPQAEGLLLAVALGAAALALRSHTGPLAAPAAPAAPA
ncbi:MAG: hypothetical protein AB1673_17450, partial [Actinomycetota bacterium]